MNIDVAETARQIATIMGPFIPHLLRGAEDKAKELAGSAWTQVKNWWDHFWPKASKNRDVREAVEEIADHPEDKDLQGALSVRIRKMLASDEAFAKLMEQMLQQAKAQMNITTTVTASGAGAIAIGRDATGSTFVTGHGARGAGDQPTEGTAKAS